MSRIREEHFNELLENKEQKDELSTIMNNL